MAPSLPRNSVTSQRVVSSVIFVILQHDAGPGDVGRLARFVPAAQQDQQPQPALRGVEAVAGAVMYAHLGRACAERLRVAEMARLRPLDASHDLCLRTYVAQPPKPAAEIG